MKRLRIKTDHLLYVGIAMLGAAMSTKLLTEQGREVCGVLIAGATAWKAKRSAGSEPPALKGE